MQTVEETDELVAIAKEAGVQLMDGTMWVHGPRAKAKSLILPLISIYFWLLLCMLLMFEDECICSLGLG